MTESKDANQQHNPAQPGDSEQSAPDAEGMQSFGDSGTKPSVAWAA